MLRAVRRCLKRALALVPAPDAADDTDADDVRRKIADGLRRWLGATDVSVAERGDLAPALTRALHDRPVHGSSGDTA